MKSGIRLSIAIALMPLGVCAAEPSAQSATADASTVKAEATAKAKVRCEDSTGSRIKPRKADCEPIVRPSRTYSRDLMQTTGEINTYEALRKLDPIFY